MNFTQAALDEIDAILDGAVTYGGARHTRKLRDRLQRLFDLLDRGIGLGSTRPELGLSDDIRFIPTAPYPFIVVFDRDRGLVLRVIHARRDYRQTVIADFWPS